MATTIESVHRDIAFANQYRLELLKLLMTLSAALLAFTFSFRPTLESVDWKWAMWAGWAGLSVSMIGGLVHMLGWDHFYKSYRDFDHGLSSRVGDALAREKGKAARKRINRWRRIAMSVQFLGFAVGVSGVAAFAAVNIDKVQPPLKTTASSAKSIHLTSPASVTSRRNEKGT